MNSEHMRNAVTLSAVGSVMGHHHLTFSNSIFPSRTTFLKNTALQRTRYRVMDASSTGGYTHMSYPTHERPFGKHMEPRANVRTFAS